MATSPKKKLSQDSDLPGKPTQTVAVGSRPLNTGKAVFDLHSICIRADYVHRRLQWRAPRLALFGAYGLALSGIKDPEERMPEPGHLESQAAVKNLKTEIDNLTAQQTDALAKATFLGMTVNEAREYDDRRTVITKLVKQLAVLRETP